MAIFTVRKSNGDNITDEQSKNSTIFSIYGISPGIGLLDGQIDTSTWEMMIFFLAFAIIKVFSRLRNFAFINVFIQKICFKRSFDSGTRITAYLFEMRPYRDHEKLKLNEIEFFCSSWKTLEKVFE